MATCLNQPAVRDQLGVAPLLSNRNFRSGSNVVNAAFFNTMLCHVASLLDCGLKALIYIGTYDWIRTWVGNEHWILALEWSGKNGFGNQELRS